ncbi:MAG: hypothetical protein K940chlam2_01801 [Chlamydiae bacterium]|nr:hypothetical protein [Chlamydiota bacterium]
MKLTHDNVFKEIERLNLKPSLQPETDQIHFVLDIKSNEVPVFTGIREESNLLQTLAYLPLQIADKTVSDTARLLHLLNHELDMPGFGMDEREKLIFYRCVIPCPEGELHDRVLEMYLSTTRLAVEAFLGAIAMITAGQTTVDEMFKNKKTANNEQ